MCVVSAQALTYVGMETRGRGFFLYYSHCFLFEDFWRQGLSIELVLSVRLAGQSALDFPVLLLHPSVLRLQKHDTATQF